MPSTAWNVFVASGVAIVVYFAMKMGQVLLGLAAGTILFLGGWLTGYAINEDLLDSMGLLRIGVAGAVSGFVVFWTVVVVEGEFLTGVLVVGLVWFAAWFTSEMGPIQGSTGAMATIDEPRPPEEPRPGTPVDLGGESPAETGIGSGGGILGTIRGIVTPSPPNAPDRDESSSPDPGGPSADELTAHSAEDAEGMDEPPDTTREVDADAGGQKESIFGLGIFYEGDPGGPPPAGADTDANEPNADSASTGTEPRNGDHTRPAVSGGRFEKTDGGTTETEASEGESAIESAAPAETEPQADPESSATEQASRLREPMDSPRRPGKAPTTESGYERYRGAASEGIDSGATTDSDPNGSADAQSVDGGDANDDSDDDPPEEHRVDVDDNGFIFG